MRENQISKIWWRIGQGKKGGRRDPKEAQFWHPEAPLTVCQGRKEAGKKAWGFKSMLPEGGKDVTFSLFPRLKSKEANATY